MQVGETFEVFISWFSAKVCEKLSFVCVCEKKGEKTTKIRRKEVERQVKCATNKTRMDKANDKRRKFY